MEELLVRLLEKVENRYYGKYRAIVEDNDDPEKRGRLRLKVPSILGKEEKSGWALPCLPYGGAADQGFFFIPEKESCVWVEFESGNLDYPVWVGSFWGGAKDNSDIPKAEELESPPVSKIIKTLSGILIQLNDSEKSLTIKDPTGNTIKMSPDEFKITAKKKLIIDAGSNDIEIKGKNLTISTDGDANIKATGNTNIEGSLINLNG